MPTHVFRRLSVSSLFSLGALKNRVRYTPWLRRAAVRRMIDPDFPAVLGIDPAGACNLDCDFCPNGLRDKKLGVMKFDLFRKIIDESVEHGRRAMLILHKDGEPLVNPRLVEMVAYAKRCDAARTLQFATNGVLLDDDKARGLISAGLDSLTVSLDYDDAALYLEHKRKDEHARVVENIHRVARLRRSLGSRTPYLIVKATALQSNQGDVERLRDRWRDVADEVVVTPYHDWAGRITVQERPEIPGRRYPCAYLWYYPSINWDGKVSVCCIDSANRGVVGDVTTTPLAEIWRGEAIAAFRQSHLRRDFAGAPLCAACTFWAEGNDDVEAAIRRRFPEQAGAQASEAPDAATRRVA
jgi:MoaA/NifB/PqqE/SkfB family radical SAM enzyme